MKRARQQKILEIISTVHVSTQEELTHELERRRITVTQSSVSRDIADLGLIKINGYYASPVDDLSPSGPIVNITTAGDNIIVVKTEVGQAQPTALKIDKAMIDEIAGTVAGDDTIFIAVPNAASQRIAVRKIARLFTPYGKESAPMRAVKRPRLSYKHPGGRRHVSRQGI